jgi:hypothetical protein
VKDQIADMADSPVALLFVGVVPLCIVTYMQVKGSIGMGMKIKEMFYVLDIYIMSPIIIFKK